MDGEGYLRLDPDVAGSREGNRLPLSDLYGLPVFADDTQQKAGELHTKEKQMLEGIRQEVFEKGGVWQGQDGRMGKEEARLTDIRNRIFETAPGSLIQEEGRQEEQIQEGRLSAEMQAVVGMAIILGIWVFFYRRMRTRTKKYAAGIRDC
ncbi:MAG: hypothetical protein K1W22_10365 [Lachnospiraceae bacterium]